MGGGTGQPENYFLSPLSITLKTRDVRLSKLLLSSTAWLSDDLSEKVKDIVPHIFSMPNLEKVEPNPPEDSIFELLSVAHTMDMAASVEKSLRFRPGFNKDKSEALLTVLEDVHATT